MLRNRESRVERVELNYITKDLGRALSGVLAALQSCFQFPVIGWGHVKIRKTPYTVTKSFEGDYGSGWILLDGVVKCGIPGTRHSTTYFENEKPRTDTYMGTVYSRVMAICYIGDGKSTRSFQIWFVHRDADWEKIEINGEKFEFGSGDLIKKTVGRHQTTAEPWDEEIKTSLAQARREFNTERENHIRGNRGRIWPKLDIKFPPRGLRFRRFVGPCQRAGIAYIGDLVTRSEQEVLAIKGIGPAMFAELKEYIHEEIRLPFGLTRKDTFGWTNPDLQKENPSK